jgi:uncharacterized protein with NRDE domain
VILATRVWSELPLLVATNRDEHLDRPSQPPSRWLEGAVAPRDERAGGTWIGCSDAGVIAAVTNRFGSERDPERRSRGEIVPMALAEPSAQEAARRITTEVADRYNPFHLVVADRVSAWLILAIEGRLVASPLPRGVHVVTERSFRDEPSDRELVLEGAVEGWSTAVPPSDAVVEGVLRCHREPSFDGVCVHMPVQGYGTRSSSVLRLPAVGDASWRFADGPPCTATFRGVQMR